MNLLYKYFITIPARRGPARIILSHDLDLIRDKNVTLNGYFCIKPVLGHTNSLCGCTQIISAFGGGGGNWSFAQACWLAAEPRPHSPSLAPVFQFPKNITL